MNVLLFARAREVIGKDRVEIAPPEPASVGELKRRLMQTYPAIAGLLEKSVFAVNDEFAEDATAIPPGAEVALLPPVSGG
jgi:molybdopterin converting factor subunit 1